MKKVLQYIKLFLSGIVFGIANIIPGVSGGTMLVVFGIYDQLTEAISGIKAIFRNIVFLLIFGLGAGVGLLGFASVISFLLAPENGLNVQTYMYFIGLILGSVPMIYRMGTSEAKVKPLCAVPFILAMAAVIGLSVLDKNFIAPAAEVVSGFDIVMTVKLLICAVIAAVAMIIPGLSGSFIMMLLGVYETIVSAIRISELNFYVIAPVAVGVIIGIIGGAKVISILIKKYKLMVYSAIMGLVIGSVYAILPEGFGFDLKTGYGFLCLLFGVLTSVLVEKLGGSENSSQQ